MFYLTAISGDYAAKKPIIKPEFISLLAQKLRTFNVSAACISVMICILDTPIGKR